MLIRGIGVTPSQAEVHRTLSDYGPLPDHALVPLAQHVSRVRQSSSGIRTRRSELYAKGLVRRMSVTTTTGSGRSAAIYEVVR